MALLWVAVLVLGVVVMDWGAGRATRILDGLRAHWGLPGTAAGALLGLATASPEIAVNLTATLFRWPDLGLGAALGSNVPALPLAILAAWLSTRRTWWHHSAAKPSEAVAKPQVVEVQIVPYFLIVALLALLTLPAPWRGLQPIDALILVAAFALFFVCAMLRPRKEERGPPPDISRSTVILGLAAIALGALGAVIAGRHITDALGISDLVGGLFLVGFLCALPETLAAWRLACEGKGTIAIASACTDGIVSLTVALVPPALAGTAVGRTDIYLVNLAFLAVVLLLYAWLNRSSVGQVFDGRRAATFVAAYLGYVLIIRALLSS